MRQKEITGNDACITEYYRLFTNHLTWPKSITGIHVQRNRLYQYLHTCTICLFSNHEEGHIYRGVSGMVHEPEK